MSGRSALALVIASVLIAGVQTVTRKPSDRPENTTVVRDSKNSTSDLKQMKTTLARLILASMLHKIASSSNVTFNHTTPQLISNSSVQVQRRLGGGVPTGRRLVKSVSRIPPFWSMKSELAPALNYQVAKYQGAEDFPLLSTAILSPDEFGGVRLFLPDDNMSILEGNVVSAGGGVDEAEEDKSESLRPVTKTSEVMDSPRCDKFTEDICLDDSEYPRVAIMNAIYRERSKFDVMYSEVKERDTQVEGLTRKQEEAYTFEHYFGPLRPTVSREGPIDYAVRGGFVCPSEVIYAQPHRAKNRDGVWKVIINVAEFTQTVRLEKCFLPGSSCSYVSGRYQSSCSQIHSYHRLVVFGKNKGLHVDMFKMPTGCSCYIKGSKYVFPPQRLPHPSPQPPPIKKPNAVGKLSHALSSLFTNKPEGQLPPNPQVLNYIQRQLAWFRYLNRHPQLMEYVSPSHVLQQLLEDEQSPPTPTRRPTKIPPANRWFVAHTPQQEADKVHRQRPPNNNNNRDKIYTVDLVPSDGDQFSEPLDMKLGFRPIRKNIAAASQTQMSATEADDSVERPAHDNNEHPKEARINFSYHPILEYLSES